VSRRTIAFILSCLPFYSVEVAGSALLLGWRLPAVPFYSGEVAGSALLLGWRLPAVARTQSVCSSEAEQRLGLMPSRSWSKGLHQAVEAKEGVTITPPTETIVRLSFQHFFRLFRRLSGMTGTGAEAAKEFWRIYQLPVLPAVPFYSGGGCRQCPSTRVEVAGSAGSLGFHFW
jgi:hypothetical protein